MPSGPAIPGSERLVGEAFRQIIPLRNGRILVASFASNVHRMQQAVDVALESGRKVCVVGRSMRKNLNIARSLGYMEVPDDALVKPDELDNYAPDKVLILCTGSQGEPMSALTRIAYHDHPTVNVERGDTVIISAKAVPGNELRVHDTINELARAGAEVLHHEIAPVHVSGHGNSEEIRTVIGLVRPKAVMPVHGEYRMLAAQARMAQDAGVPAKSIVLAENGSVVELSASGVRLADRVDSGVMFVDGLAVGDISDVALRDRRRLSEDGVVIVVATLSSSNGKATATPELIARGFAEADELLEELRAKAGLVLDELLEAEHPRDQAAAATPSRRPRSARVRPHAEAPAHLARGRRGMSAVETRDWAGALTCHAIEPETGRRLVAQLRACEVSALAFCRLLERWARGEAEPSSPGRREAALQRAADRAETAIAGLEKPLARYLLELEPDVAEGRSWYGEPGPAELVAWDDVLTRAGVHARALSRGAGVPRARGARSSAGRSRRSCPRRLPTRPQLAVGGTVRSS